MIQAILDRAVALARPAAEQGAPASYIPELAKTDPRQLGACIFTLDGGRFPQATPRCASASRASPR